MPVDLPPIAGAELAARLRAVSPEPLDDETVARLGVHYAELRRWARRLALVGPGTAASIVSRHFGESLAALPLLDSSAGTLVDLGSGAGFPGLVLAAARPTWRVTLVEARERKAAFLSSVARRASLSVHCLNARVGPRSVDALPDRIDLVTMRAVRLSQETMDAIAGRLATGGRWLVWAGSGWRDWPAGFRQIDCCHLPDSDERFLLVAGRGSESR